MHDSAPAQPRARLGALLLAVGAAAAAAWLVFGVLGRTTLPDEVAMGRLDGVVARARQAPVTVPGFAEVAVIAVDVRDGDVRGGHWGVATGEWSISRNEALVALDLRDPRGGLVAWCPTSRRWEHPDRPAAYAEDGRWRGGPSQRGLDRFAIRVEGDQVIVDTTRWVSGAPRQATDQDIRPVGQPCD